MKCSIFNFSGDIVGETDLPERLFGASVRRDILHQVVCWQLSKRRSGTHMTKTRSNVRGSTRKIYQQKGTGRARHGAKKAPLFRGGGVTFGPLPRSYEYKLNKKVRFTGLCSAISLKFEQGHFTLLESLSISSHKTSDFLKSMTSCNLKSVKSALFVDENCVECAAAKSASSNLHNFLILPVCGLNVYDVLRYENLVFTVGALTTLKNRLQRLTNGL
jgi:large subunit ribosomal protein L4